MEIDTLILSTGTPLPAPLEKYHVVLGRYNREKKTKALTPAVRMYKKVRDQVERGKNKGTEQLEHVKHKTSCLLQEELAYAEPPLVSFWVDIHKAEKDGKLDELQRAHPQLRTCIDFDGEEVVFVQDHQDYYLKADLAGHKKNRSKKSSSHSHHSQSDNKKNRSLKLTLESNHIVRARGGDVDTSTCTSSVTSATRTVSTLGSSTCGTCTSKSNNNQQRALFQLQPPLTATSTSLEEEVERICCHWILLQQQQEQEERSSQNSSIQRKTALVEILKSYIAYYQRILAVHDPCQHSPVKILQQMNETILYQVTNTLGNSMVEWYEQYPHTCLPGEANEWNKELSPQQHPVVEPSMSFSSTDAGKGPQSDSESGGAMEKGSVGTYEMSEEDEGMVAQTSRHLSEFHLANDRRGDSPHSFQAEFDDTPFTFPTCNDGFGGGRSEHSSSFMMDVAVAGFDDSGGDMALSDESAGSTAWTRDRGGARRDWSPFNDNNNINNTSGQEGSGRETIIVKQGVVVERRQGYPLLMTDSSPDASPSNHELGSSSQHNRAYRRWKKPPSFKSKRYVKLDSLKSGGG